ncbi:electron transfer flavoprotein subunit beta [Shewanella mangrovi]|uniref:Electron transfer flavoprotein subunit alpha n=1 Tax=Shewanella mangrovi TaxID=1515746 RepID=A0A094J9Z5_9GAMM|nr:FAD-binding protein [Shewanella mangrovi]KFZ36082.1 electron transfer flavoprotein subunit beta [Shewanella mangrovi]
MAVLVIAEHDNAQLKADVAKAVTAAAQLGQEIHVLVAGAGCQAVAESAAKMSGVAKVLLADNSVYQHQLAENFSELVVANAAGYSHIVSVASAFGKDLLPRVAALLDVAMIADIVAVKDADTFVRPIYAGNALATVKSLDDVKVVSIRSTAFDAASSDGSADIVAVEQVFTPVSEFVSKTELQSERPELGSANVVVSGGRALGSAENFALIEQLADKLGGAVGASRAAVDAGYVANDLQVGQTGKIVAPSLYIAVGISGAIQHLAGMKDAKVIVAINKDPQAPIFQIADYGLEADLFEALPKLIEMI